MADQLLASRAETFNDLATRAEALAGPDRGLDAAIRTALAGSTFTAGNAHNPRYTGSLDAAMTLVPEGWFGFVPVNFGDACLWPKLEAAHGIFGQGATPALALTAVALRAKARGEA